MSTVILLNVLSHLVSSLCSYVRNLLLPHFFLVYVAIFPPSTDAEGVLEEHFVNDPLYALVVLPSSPPSRLHTLPPFRIGDPFGVRLSVVAGAAGAVEVFNDAPALVFALGLPSLFFFIFFLTTFSF